MKLSEADVCFMKLSEKLPDEAIWLYCILLQRVFGFKYFYTLPLFIY